MLPAIQEFFTQQIFPNLYAFYAKRKIQKQIVELERGSPHFSVVFSEDPDLDLAGIINELKDYIDREDDRKRAIDDKAKSSLLIITISSTVMLTGLNLIKEGKIYFRLPLLLIVLLGVIYFILSAITSVAALNLSRFYVLHPDDWIKQIYGKQTITNLKKLDKIHHLYNNLKLNERVLNIRSNFVSATLIGIRNGVILLSIAFAIALSNIGNQVKYADSSIDQKPHDTFPAMLERPEQNQTPTLPSNPTPLPDNQQEPKSQNPVNPESIINSNEQQVLPFRNENTRNKNISK